VVPGAVQGAHRQRGLPNDASVRRTAERENKIVHWSTFDRGGHFAAMEVPDLLVGDIREFYSKLR
jgi:pimeloyl-ACP methyl ester carboxylesterase